jgi:hypothetical protein
VTSAKGDADCASIRRSQREPWSPYSNCKGRGPANFIRDRILRRSASNGNPQLSFPRVASACTVAPLVASAFRGENTGVHEMIGLSHMLSAAHNRPFRSYVLALNSYNTTTLGFINARAVTSKVLRSAEPSCAAVNTAMATRARTGEFGSNPETLAPYSSRSRV